jgi:hypothetical protein
MNDKEAISSGGPLRRQSWNKGKLVGAKAGLRVSHVWSIRTKLQLEGRIRDLALFDLAIDSKLRGCDVVAVCVDDVAPNGYTLDCRNGPPEEEGSPSLVRIHRADTASHRRASQNDPQEARRIPVRRSR